MQLLLPCLITICVPRSRRQGHSKQIQVKSDGAVLVTPRQMLAGATALVAPLHTSARLSPPIKPTSFCWPSASC